MKRFVVIAAILTTLTACASSEYGHKETLGTLLGAIGGGIAGAQFGSGSGRVATTAVGTIIGAFVGNSTGRSLDRVDRAYYSDAHQTALEKHPSGDPVEWHNPDSGNYGTVTPVQTYRDDNGRYCREYQQEVVIAGERQQAYGTACRQPDGTWRIIDGPA